jgi:hypothetical protein
MALTNKLAYITPGLHVIRLGSILKNFLQLGLNEADVHKSSSTLIY